MYTNYNRFKSLFVRVITLCLIVLLFGCEDNKSKPSNTKTKTSKEVSDPIIKKDSVKTPEREFPKLDKSNAMEFFLEYEKHNKENKVRLTTTHGEIDILLHDKTKFHRANFIFLTKQGYFDGTQFHRVVKNFIIQGGNSDSRKISKRRKHIGRYLLPTDTKRGFKHDRGVISMPSSEIKNPHKLASPYEFFIVQQKEGAHHLNGSYTVFGKVIRGMDVVDKISELETDNRDWPLTNAYIQKVEIID